MSVSLRSRCSVVIGFGGLFVVVSLVAGALVLSNLPRLGGAALILLVASSLSTVAGLALVGAVRWTLGPVSRLLNALPRKGGFDLAVLSESDDEIGALGRVVLQDQENRIKVEVQHEELAAAHARIEAQELELANLASQLDQRVADRTRELEEAIDTAILGWCRALDARAHDTEGHTQRVTHLALLLGQAWGLDKLQMRRLRLGALLHDIGKIGIPDAILLKEGKLNDAEFELMRQHPVIAYEMLDPIPFLSDCLEVPLFHHEKWNGTGYPRQLAGEEIPVLARIFAVADVWDALRSDRPYREGWPEEQVRAYLASQAGFHFDPRVVELFLELPPQFHPKDAEERARVA